MTSLLFLAGALPRTAKNEIRNWVVELILPVVGSMLIPFTSFVVAEILVTGVAIRPFALEAGPEYLDCAFQSVKWRARVTGAMSMVIVRDNLGLASASSPKDHYIWLLESQISLGALHSIALLGRTLTYGSNGQSMDSSD